MLPWRTRVAVLAAALFAVVFLLVLAVAGRFLEGG